MLDAQTKRKLVWHCRRGMLELDLMLQDFLIKRVDMLTPFEIKSFESLLSSNDPQLYAWLIGQEEPTDSELKKIVALIRTCP
ncbi:MAG: succinate dehydrogenase assembly factor 2 [Legionella sp.]|nr:succinate dehydrogenase assembly factor 2 [Legionella sp.]